METSPDSKRLESGHDASLIRWFANLSPDQRLDELESRVAFLHSLRALGLEALIAEKRRMGRSKDIAAAELLEEVLRHRNARD